MLPRAFPSRPELEVAAVLRPARSVGGDLYDVVDDGSRVWLLIGDVSGKGVGAALFMAVTKTLFRALAPGAPSVAEAVDTGQPRAGARQRAGDVRDRVRRSARARDGRARVRRTPATTRPTGWRPAAARRSDGPWTRRSARSRTTRTARNGCGSSRATAAALHGRRRRGPQRPGRGVPGAAARGLPRRARRGVAAEALVRGLVERVEEFAGDVAAVRRRDRAGAALPRRGLNGVVIAVFARRATPVVK